MIHHEPRQMKAYALVVDKDGPKLTPKDEPFHPAPVPSGQAIIEAADDTGSSTPFELRSPLRAFARTACGGPDGPHWEVSPGAEGRARATPRWSGNQD